MKYYTKEWYLSKCPPVKIPNDSSLIDDSRISTHDCVVLSNEIENERDVKFILELDNSGGFCSFNRICFNNYAVKKNCSKIKNSFCIAEELYKKPNGWYEFHVLLNGYDKNRNNSEKEWFDDLIVVCESIEFVGDGFYLTYKKG
ncbi:MAG: DUF4085 domain-containing protein [Clostridium sp.]|nr:DUF4085 domain-containing protein [Clostridium sp.]